MAKGIISDIVIGNLIICSKENSISKEAVYNYLDIVDSLLPEDYYIWAYDDAFKSFCYRYDFLINYTDEKLESTSPISLLERYFKIGLSKRLISVFEKAFTLTEI